MLRWFAIVAGLALFLGCSQSDPNHLGDARQHLRQARWWEAVAACDRALKVEEGNPEALLIRGQAHFELKLYDRAIRDYSNLIRVRPDDAEGYHRRALTHAMLGDVERSYTDRQRARELDPDLKSARPFENSTVSPMNIPPKDESPTTTEDVKSVVEVDEEELETFPGYGAELEDEEFDGSQELATFTPQSPRVGRDRPRPRTPSTPFDSKLPRISFQREERVAEGDDGEPQQDLFRQWISQRRNPPSPRRVDPPAGPPPAAMPAPDVPLEEPSGPTKPTITTALPIDVDGRPLVWGKRVRTPNLSLPLTTGLTSGRGGAASARSAAGVRNFRRPANASLNAGSLHANPIYSPSRPSENDLRDPSVEPGNPVISTAIDPNQVARPSAGVTTGIHSQPVNPE